ncbi:HD domain-containing phosphohydrolase [Novispirillum sp. DQ9]|uniref:HD domain-containing phosphohydrolase n=1 Tax=Novispirillum sp. DQ9 TaxID=3398612 RepID=UPI003C7981D6
MGMCDDGPGPRVVPAEYLDALFAAIEGSAGASGVRPRIFFKDAAGRFVRVNAAFAEDAGLSPEEVISRTDFDLYPQDLATGYRSDDATVLVEGLRRTVEETYMRGGERRLVRTTKTPVFAEDGTAVGIVGVLVDVTEERRRLERAGLHARLIEAGQRLADLGTWSYRSEADEFECSEQLIRIVGQAECSGRGKLHHFLGLFEPAARARIERVLAGEDPEDALEHTDFWIRRGDGTRRCLAMRIQVSHGPLGFQVVGTVQDITGTRNKERELLRLNQIFRALSDSRSAQTRSVTEEELMHGVCQALTGQGLFPLAWIGEPSDAPGKPIHMRGAAGSAVAYLAGIGVSWSDDPSGRGPTGTAVKTRQPVVVQDTGTSALFSPWAERARRHGLRSNAAVPIISDQRVIAVLTVYSTEPEAFGAEELKLLTAFADDLGHGIAALRMRTQLSALLEERKLQEGRLREGMIRTIEALASTLESRDPYTAGHQSRVAEIACQIAGRMSLDPERVEGLRLAAMVHDIGKIRVPIQILCKPTRLSEIEFELIKTHSAAGYEILRNLGLPWPIAEIVLQHHEYLDGTGYPNGIHGEEIRMESRILTVADIVESMSSARPYRPALGMECALAEIQRLRGSRLDPKVVDACLEVFASPKAPQEEGGAEVLADVL